MKEVSIVQAKARLSAVLRQVERGEAVVVTRHNRPVARITREPQARKGLRPYGLAKGAFVVPDSFNDPLPDDLLDLYDGKGT